MFSSQLMSVEQRGSIDAGSCILGRDQQGMDRLVPHDLPQEPASSVLILLLSPWPLAAMASLTTWSDAS